MNYEAIVLITSTKR